MTLKNLVVSALALTLAFAIAFTLVGATGPYTSVMVAAFVAFVLGSISSNIR